MTERTVTDKGGAMALHVLPPEEPILYRPEDAARALGIGRSKLFELLAEGQIPSIQIGRARRVSRHALVAFAARMESGESAP